MKVAWSSCGDNQISIINIETKLEYANFEGTRIRNPGSQFYTQSTSETFFFRL